MNFSFKKGGNKIEQQKAILNRAKKKMIEFEKAGGSSTEMDLYKVLTEEEQLVLAANMSKQEKESTKCDSELYCATMKKLIFKTIPFYNQMCIPYHFETLLRTSFPDGVKGTAAKRLAKELASLHNSLPISANSSIFVRACEERLDVMKVLIIGPAETPYANGCFEFDVFFPSNYPNEPMRINFETTGNKTVRFNPNLYEDGKVCLSILNTWSGSKSERWDPSKSSLLQVLVSIQALVFVEEPYYNEPGYESMRNTQKGERQSCDYNARIRHECLRWAMLQQLQNPPKAFADVIECHFWLKGEEICAQVDEWIEDCERLVKAGKVYNSDLRKLKMVYEKLKLKFSSMKCPSALQAILLDKKEDDDKKIGKANDDSKYDEYIDDDDEGICNCSIL